MARQQRKKVERTSLRPRTLSADVGARSKVVALKIAHCKKQFWLQDDYDVYVHDLHVLGCAAPVHDVRRADTTLAC